MVKLYSKSSAKSASSSIMRTFFFDIYSFKILAFPKLRKLNYQKRIFRNQERSHATFLPECTEQDVRPFTVIRYEADESKPTPEVRDNLRRAFKLNGELDRYFPAPLQRVTKRSTI